MADQKAETIKVKNINKETTKCGQWFTLKKVISGNTNINTRVEGSRKEKCIFVPCLYKLSDLDQDPFKEDWASSL